MQTKRFLALLATSIAILSSCGGSGGDSSIAVSSVNISATSLSLEVGESALLTATVSPTGASNKTISWSTSDSKVASVTEGTVTGVSAGSATITASAGGKSATCAVTVSAPVDDSGFSKGADVSWVTEMENDGRSFSDSKGNTDLFSVLASLGMDAVRLRVWVEPTTGGWCTTDDLVAKAKRAAKCGMDVMVDFHYSSFFADPSSQTTPSAWEGLSVSELSQKVASHTKEVLSALKSAGVTPKWVQVGNETTNGMLWDAGALYDSSWKEKSNGWSDYATLSNAGYDAVKAVFPSAIVIVHINHAYDDNAWWFTKFSSAGGKFDMIGLSHYPQSDNSSITWSQMNQNAVTNLKKLSSAFGCKVMICETGVQVSDVTTGAKVMSDLMTRVKKLDECAGVFYWEPETDGSWKPAIYTSKGWNAYGMGAFTTSGQPTAILDCFAD